MAKSKVYSELLDKVRRLAQSSNPFDGANELPKIPDDKGKLSDFINVLFEDAKNYRDSAYVNRLGQTDPIKFWRNCFLLQSGNHWEVYGRRILDAKKDIWKAELIDDEIGNQIRVKKSYLTANWHKFLVLPNVARINEIVNQEQQKSDWDRIINETADRMCTYGSVMVKSVMDYDLHPEGVATEVVCDNASILLSPNSTSIRRSDGCWYIIHATIQPLWLVDNMYRDSMEKLGVKLTDISTVKPENMESITGINPSQVQTTTGYRYTQTTDVLETWMDDFTLEPAPFTPEEAQMESGAILQGTEVPVLPEQNHKAHLEAHLSYLAELNQLAEAGDDADKQNAELLNTAMEKHIEKHLQFRQDGMQLKYPYGRKVVRAGGKIVQDVPNPFKFDWHKLFHWADFEKVTGQVWGRGLAEILWKTNETEDLMLCRIADIGLASVPKPWLSWENKALWEEQNVNNAPNEPAFYKGAAPQFPQGRTPVEFTTVFKMTKDNAEKTQGISSVTYGDSPSPTASGDLAEILLRQNSVIVTGEANTNLGKLVEEIIEARLLMMKQFYTEPRSYYLDGAFKHVNVSDILSFQTVSLPTGEQVKEPLPDLEVKIKPNSNLPNQWETDLNLIIGLSKQLQNEDGTSPIPMKAILDILGERYPQFAPGGDYSVLSQATQLGLQLMRKQQEEQAQAAEQEKTLQDVAKSVTRRQLIKQIEPQTKES